MFFLFDAWDKVDPRTQLSEEDRQATRMVRSCWVSFAKTGKPQCDGAPDWPRYTPQDDRLMELGVKAEVRKNFRKQQLDAHEAVMQDGLDKAAKSNEDSLRKLEDEEAHR
jgi:para-nitrobenzyl esterase